MHDHNKVLLQILEKRPRTWMPVLELAVHVRLEQRGRYLDAVHRPDVVEKIGGPEPRVRLRNVMGRPQHVPRTRIRANSGAGHAAKQRLYGGDFPESNAIL